MTKEIENDLWDIFIKENMTKHPEIILLLDGFNEVTIKNDRLIFELNKIVSEAKNVQLIVTSRYAEIEQYHWTRLSRRIDLVPLALDQIEKYLKDTEGKMPTNPELITLLGNPMMLAIYASTDSIFTKYSKDSRFTFHPVQTVAELLWNFQEAHLAKNLEALEGNETEQVYVTFLTRYLVPFLAWRMEKEGQFFVTSDIAQNIHFNFNSLIGEACRYLRRRGVLALFPKIASIPQRLTLKDLKEDEDDLFRSDTIQETLVRNLHILVAEGNELRFLHQNFRDFYAAYHLRNSILFSLVEGILPLEWKERVVPVYLRKMLGEIEGEYLFDPYALLDGAAVPERITKNLISKLLDACRGKDMDGDYTVWNLVTILNETRGNLLETNLTNLDLLALDFNDFQLSTMSNRHIISSKVKNSKLKGEQFFYKNHRYTINKACYSPKGDKILSISDDGKINELSAQTGVLIRTIEAHTYGINAVSYSPDGSKILSAASDKTIKEWSAKTGFCLNTFEVQKSVRNACYNHTGTKILYVLSDKSVTELCVASGKKLWNLQKWSNWNIFASYNCDGSKILSISDSGIIKEWSALTKECLKTIISDDLGIDSIYFNQDSNKLLLGYSKGKIIEWSIMHKRKMKTIKAESHSIRSICYSHDELRILSLAIDGSIKEWSAETGDFLRTFSPFTYSAKSICYNPNGDKILITYKNLIAEFSNKTWNNTLCIQRRDRLSGDGCYSSDGKSIFVTSNDGILKRFSLKTNQCIQYFRVFGNPIDLVCIHPRLPRVLSYSMGHIQEWSLAKGTCITLIACGQARSICYNMQGNNVLIIDQLNIISEWSLESKKKIRQLNIDSEGHSKRIILACYSNFRNSIISGSVDGTLCEWSLDTSQCDRSQYEIKNEEFTYTFNKEKDIVLGLSKNGIFWQWNPETGHRIKLFDENIKPRLELLCSNFEGTKYLFLYYRKSVYEYSMITRTYAEKFQLDNSFLLIKVCYSLDDSKILSITDGSINEWSAKTGEHLRTIQNEIGLFTQGLDLRQIHPDSKFTDEEKERLRRYGAIFTDEDEKIWKEALEDAYGDESQTE